MWLPASGDNTQTAALLASESFDEPFGQFAPGWFVNFWDGSPQFDAGQEQFPPLVHGGTGSQWLSLLGRGGGGFQWKYDFNPAQGTRYRIRFFVMASVPTSAQFLIRRDAPPWDAMVQRTLPIGPSEWTEVVLDGVYTGSEPGSLRIVPLEEGPTYWIDDLTVERIDGNIMQPHGVITGSTSYGVEINRLGEHATWPALGQGMVRLWDTGTMWRDVEPAPGVFDFESRLDMYVDQARAHGSELLYTFGGVPGWAARDPGSAGIYGPGTASPPRDNNDFRAFVHALAQHYAGRIRYYEIWNEADNHGFWNGTPAELAELARIAREELQAVDPANQLVSSGLTVDTGDAFLEDYLAAGGGDPVDVIGFHWYYTDIPEDLIGPITNVRNILAARGITKPLWNTEGSPLCSPRLHDCSTFVASPEVQRGVNARAMLMMWAQGVSAFDYYLWESQGVIAPLVQPDLVSETEAGAAYRQFTEWTRYTSIFDAYQLDRNVFVYRIAQGFGGFTLLHAVHGPVAVMIPPEWQATQLTTLRGERSALTPGVPVVLGAEPVRIE